MEKERLIEELIIGVFLRLKLDGYCDEISLKRDDVQEVAQKLENVLIENGLSDSDIFIKTPVEETYDYFKTWLSDRFLSLHLGVFTEPCLTYMLEGKRRLILDLVNIK